MVVVPEEALHEFRVPLNCTTNRHRSARTNRNANPAGRCKYIDCRVGRVGKTATNTNTSFQVQGSAIVVVKIAGTLQGKAGVYIHYSTVEGNIFIGSQNGIATQGNGSVVVQLYVSINGGRAVTGKGSTIGQLNIAYCNHARYPRTGKNRTSIHGYLARQVKGAVIVEGIAVIQG